MFLNDGIGVNPAKVDESGVLMVGLDGFTLEDLAQSGVEVKVGIHVKHGDKWVPVNLNDLDVATCARCGCRK